MERIQHNLSGIDELPDPPESGSSAPDFKLSYKSLS